MCYLLVQSAVRSHLCATYAQAAGLHPSSADHIVRSAVRVSSTACPQSAFVTGWFSKLHAPSRHLNRQYTRSRPSRRAVTRNSAAVNIESLMDAVKAGDEQKVKAFLASSGASVAELVNQHSSARGGWTCLHLAAYYRHPQLVRLLLDAGAQVDARNDSGNTSLQFAAMTDDIGVAQMLLDAGADIHAQSSDRGTAVDYANEWGTQDMLDFLLVRSCQVPQE
eukprot:jgi/Mesvir1/8194/Mv12489-RA.1